MMRNILLSCEAGVFKHLTILVSLYSSLIGAVVGNPFIDMILCYIYLYYI